MSQRTPAGCRVEVGDDELVVDDLAHAAVPFGSERRRHLVRKVGKGDERRDGGVAGFLYLEGADVRGMVGLPSGRPGGAARDSEDSDRRGGEVLRPPMSQGRGDTDGPSARLTGVAGVTVNHRPLTRE